MVKSHEVAMFEISEKVEMKKKFEILREIKRDILFNGFFEINFEITIMCA